MSPRASKVRTGPPTPDLVGPAHLPWQDAALCTQHDPELWFCETESEHYSAREYRRRETIAKDICSGCTVRAECLAYALATDQHWGIWGGLSAWQRRQLTRAGRSA